MHSQLIKGRGAISNPSNRFQPVVSEVSESNDEVIAKIETQIYQQIASTVLSKNSSPDVPHERSLNPYAGCEHGCVYCYARPTHAYHDFSPGLDFETKIIAKTNAAECFEQEINQPSYRVKPFLLGANTDPYQPAEQQHKLTRKILTRCLKHNHPVSLITKSTLIERDVDLLAQLAEKGLCSVRLSVTTLNNELKRKLEPRTASGDARLQTVSKLVASGIPTGVLIAPVIPSINDSEIEGILQASKEAGACSASYILLRLPLEVKELFIEWLQAHYPQRAKHVLSLIQQSRGGKLNDSTFNRRMTGQGVFSEVIAQRFLIACQKLSIKVDQSERLNTQLFQGEAKLADKNHQEQMSLF